MSASRLVGVFENNENSFRVFEFSSCCGLWVVGLGCFLKLNMFHCAISEARLTRKLELKFSSNWWSGKKHLTPSSSRYNQSKISVDTNVLIDSIATMVSFSTELKYA
jgi:hypothetical protein